ncbi:unnamed protein product [Didymodactylos carnosus]|uniref:Uncharacterized protein n=1 Tax=Didymodactylos carnosus TaxID=1234261 RepID=A0A8S2EQ93_9BILA|nr:unnamed protein product [Didymodactylos carnosus]CAF4032769.1 unnamed protein product [Didymodactylos carnosus]
MEKKRSNLETYSIVYLSDNETNIKINDITKELRKTINFVKSFSTCQQCQKYIEQTEEDNMILVVAHTLCREILSAIHDLKQVCAVYVHETKDDYYDWSIIYKKVQGVFVKFNDLCSKLTKDQLIREKKTENTISVIIFNRNETDTTHMNLKVDNGNFMWFQLFIETLLRMEQTIESKLELVELCKEYYTGNQRGLELLHEFEETYRSDDAIRWYTRECCFYRLLNKALRIRNIELLFSCRFLISDIFKQLKEAQRSNHDHLIIQGYRGQLISKDELIKMESSIGEFISISSFLSTSRSREHALGFIASGVGDDEEHLAPVLFEIQAHTYLQDTKPFADIKHLSYFHDEEEVLFMLGTVFRIKSVIYDSVWTVQLTLCSENDHELKEIFAYIKKEMSIEADFFSLGRSLRVMSEYKMAKKYYERILNELLIANADYTNMAHCYDGLGFVALGEADYQLALKNYEKAFSLRLNSFNNLSDPHIGYSHLFIATVLDKLKDYDQSLAHYRETLNIWLKCYGYYHENIAWCLGNMGNVYCLQEQYKMALTSIEQSQEIMEKILPQEHPNRAWSYYNLGDVFVSQNNYSKALFNYRKALELRLRTLPSNHYSIADTYNSIGHVYELTGEYELALEQYKQALKIRQSLLSSTHPFILIINDNIQRMIERIR